MTKISGTKPRQSEKSADRVNIFVVCCKVSMCCPGCKPWWLPAPRSVISEDYLNPTPEVDMSLQRLHLQFITAVIHSSDPHHYSDVTMSAMASQITGVSIVCSTICSGANQREHQSSASLAFARGINRWPVVHLTKSQWHRNASIWWRRHGNDAHSRKQGSNTVFDTLQWCHMSATAP